MAIFDIQKFCITDGPGIRTTVFLKGCPLDCLWCHNPESKSGKREIFYRAFKCIGCGKCMIACTEGCQMFNGPFHVYDRVKCTACGRCADACPANALEAVGYEESAEDIIKDVMRDDIFYRNSGGGLTVSGGEPMLQFEFLFELLTEAKKNGLHVCLETCGFASPEHYEKIAGLTDIFLFDYKETDSVKHKEFTGADNSLILSNLRMLDSLGAKTILRCPIIPSYNDRDDHFEGIARTAESLKNVIEINVEPYHPLGKGKAESLGKKYFTDSSDVPDAKTVDLWLDKIRARTHVPVRRT